MYKLTDAWRSLNKDKQCFTWRTKSFRIQCRLDFFLVSQELIQSTKVRANNNPHNRNIRLEVQRATARLKKIMLTNTKGAIRWHEEGERNTKYFYSLEKRHHDIKTVSKLKVGNNCYIEDQF